jgi:hypothetical protein
MRNGWELLGRAANSPECRSIFANESLLRTLRLIWFPPITGRPQQRKESALASCTPRYLACLLAGAMLCAALPAGASYRMRDGDRMQLAQQAQSARTPASSPRTRGAGVALPPRGSEEHCRLRWLEYRRSQACFAPFRTVTGIKPEAFAVCGREVLDPSSECGAPQAP